MNNESYDFEERKYINPTVSRDEQLGFIDRLRDVEARGMNQIARDTHALGTDVPSNLGGLTGSAGLWNRMYVAPRVNTMVSGLRATAQAQALSDILANYQNQMKQRYAKAYREYAKKNAQNSAGGTAGSGISVNDGTTILGDGSSDLMNTAETGYKSEKM